MFDVNLCASIGKFLKLYQNGVNGIEERTAVKAAILSYDKQLIKDKLLPADGDVDGGEVLMVDIESENDADSIAEGKFIILYKRRIFSSMRFIVLKAEIGESVLVTDQQ